MSPIEWFYSQENKQIGPVSAAEMKRLAATGKLTPSSLVWREGMEECVPAGKVKGLFDEEIPAPHGPSAAEAGRPGFEESAARFQRSREGTSQHLFDSLLDLARSQLTPHFVDSAERVFSIPGSITASR